MAVSCPSCRGQVTGAVEVCPACGYSADVVVGKFPFAAPAFDALIDVEGVARVEEHQVRAVIGEFVERFPQLRVVVCILRLSPGTDIRQFGHWMMNASPLAAGETTLDRRRTLMLIMDLDSSDAGITLGYDLEAFLGEAAARSALVSAAPQLATGRFTEGIRVLLKEIGCVLSEVSSRLAGPQFKG